MTAHCDHRIDFADAVLYCIGLAGHDGDHTYSQEAWDAL